MKTETPIIKFIQTGDKRISKVSLTSDTENSNIYFTIDGTIPSIDNGTLYTEPFEQINNITLKAIAICEGYEDSDILEKILYPTFDFSKINNTKTEIILNRKINGVHGIKGLNDGTVRNIHCKTGGYMYGVTSITGKNINILPYGINPEDYIENFWNTAKSLPQGTFKKGAFYFNGENIVTYNGSEWLVLSTVEINGQVNFVSSLNNLPTDKRLIIANISNSINQMLSFNGNMTEGQEIHIIINNNMDNLLTVTIPSNDTYINLIEASTFLVKPNGIGEINFISDGTKVYIRGL